MLPIYHAIDMKITTSGNNIVRMWKEEHEYDQDLNAAAHFKMFEEATGGGGEPSCLGFPLHCRKVGNICEY